MSKENDNLTVEKTKIDQVWKNVNARINNLKDREIQQAIIVLKKDYHIIKKVDCVTITDDALLDIITKTVAAWYNITTESIRSTSRAGNLPITRYIIFYLTLQIRKKMSLKVIGRYFNKTKGNAHCVVIHGVKEVEDKMKIYPVFKADVDSLHFTLIQTLNK